MARKSQCIRLLVKVSFIILGISGVVVCGAGSYFVDQLHGSMTKSRWYGPAVLLLMTGILNMLFGPFSWFFFDPKYNRLQLLMFLTLTIFVAIIQATAGIWAFIDHGKVDTAISNILQQNLASVGSNDQKSGLNSTEIKINCCGFEDSTSLAEELNDKDHTITWSCCNAKPYIEHNQELGDKNTCSLFYVDECRDLALHRYRSVLIDVFAVSFGAAILQILEAIGLHAYAKRCMNKKRRQSFVRSSSQQHPRATCTGVQLGPQHVCEGCSTIHCCE